MREGVGMRKFEIHCEMKSCEGYEMKATKNESPGTAVIVAGDQNVDPEGDGMT